MTAQEFAEQAAEIIFPKIDKEGPGKIRSATIFGFGCEGEDPNLAGVRCRIKGVSFEMHAQRPSDATQVDLVYEAMLDACRRLEMTEVELLAEAERVTKKGTDQ